MAGHNCLLHLIKAPTHVWSLRHGTDQSAVQVGGTLRSNLGDVLKSAAVMGQGISMHPYYMVSDELASGSLVQVLSKYKPPSLEIYAIYPTRQNLPVRVRTFVAELREWAQTTLPARDLMGIAP